MLRALLITLSVLMTLSACVPVPVVLPASAPGGAVVSRQAVSLPSTTPVYPGFHRALNQMRRTAGVPPLSANRDLDVVAARFAAELRRTGRLAHRDQYGRKATGRVRAAGVSTCPAGENLARGYGTATEAFSGWSASRSHRANMVNAGYANYGLGRSGDVWVLVLLYPC